MFPTSLFSLLILIYCLFSNSSCRVGFFSVFFFVLVFVLLVLFFFLLVGTFLSIQTTLLHKQLFVSLWRWKPPVMMPFLTLLPDGIL